MINSICFYLSTWEISVLIQALSIFAKYQKAIGNGSEDIAIAEKVMERLWQIKQ